MLKFEMSEMREFSIDELREKLVVEYSDLVKVVCIKLYLIVMNY